MLPSAAAVCSGQQLAEVIGVTLRQIERLAVAGVLKPVRCKLRGKHFRLAESIQRYLAYREKSVIEQTKGADNDYIAARASRMRALAEQEEMNLRLRKGELLRSDDVDFTVTKMLTATKSHFLALASRISRLLLPHVADETSNANFQSVYKIVNDEVRLCLTEASEFTMADIISRADRAEYLGIDEQTLEEIEQQRNGEEPQD
jgi:phage terminase Nu1 subunit (DNA packaging protein)